MDPSPESVQALQQRVNELEVMLAHTRSELAAANSRAHDYQEDVLHLEVQGAMAQLVRGLAHELNNPLAAVLGHTQRLARLVSDDDHRRRCEIIQGESERCIELVTKLRSYTTPMTESLVPCAWSDLVELAIMRLHEHGRAAPAIQVAADAPDVLAARRSMGRVLEVILDNASLSGATDVVIRGSIEFERVRITVDNNGDIPTDEEVRNAIKPFYSTRQAVGASGLGLAFGRRFVARYGWGDLSERARRW